MYRNQNIYQRILSQSHLHPKQKDNYPLEMNAMRTQRKCILFFFWFLLIRRWKSDEHGDFHTSKRGSTFLVSIRKSTFVLGHFCVVIGASVKMFISAMFKNSCLAASHRSPSDEMIPVSTKVWISHIVYILIVDVVSTKDDKTSVAFISRVYND